MNTSTYKIIIYMLIFLIVGFFTSSEIFAQNHKTESKTLKQTITNPLIQSHFAPNNLQSQTILQQGDSKSTTFDLSQYSVADNERWDDQYGSAYVTDYVSNIREHDGNIYLSGDLRMVSDGKKVLEVHGVAAWDGNSFTSFPGEVSGNINDIAFIGSDIFIAGSFITINDGDEDIEVNNIAKWNGNTWSSLGSGTNGEVLSLLVVGNTLYVGGEFTETDGENIPYIARWSENSETWSNLSGSQLNGPVNIIESDGTNIYAGGSFDNDDLNYVAKWGGTDWEGIDDGFNDTVTSLLFENNHLYATGNFTETNDGSTLRYVAVFDFSAEEAEQGWDTPANSSPDDVVTSISSFDGEIVIGGLFQNIGISEINGVAKLTNGEWNSLGSGLQGDVLAVQHMNDGTLYAGGNFSGSSSKTITNFAEWDGNQWNRAGSQNETISFDQLNNDAAIFDVVQYKGDLIATGLFEHISGTKVNSIARWDGTEWHSLEGGLLFDEEPGIGFSLLVHDDELYVGGTFDKAGTMVQPTNNIAKWDGTQWSRLGSGLSHDSNNVLIFTIQEFNGDIFVGGRFTDATGVPVGNVARWSDGDWYDFGYGVGEQSNDMVYGLHYENDNLYVGGNFEVAGHAEDPVDVSNIAVWSESDQEWNTLGDGLDNYVYSIFSYNGTVIAGGEFEASGQTPIHGLAEWDPVDETWMDFNNAATDSGFGIVDAIVIDETLYVAGSFSSIDGEAGVNSIASYHPDEGWNSLGNGIKTFDMPGVVYNLNQIDGRIFSTGIFTTAGDKSANSISSWDLQLGVSVEEPVSEAPVKYSLDQNYPNPFNPTTNIQFEIEEPAMVALQVFDMAGRQVASIVDNQLSSGSHTVHFDASNLSSGIYLYRLNVHSASGQSFTQSRKMTLIK